MKNLRIEAILRMKSFLLVLGLLWICLFVAGCSPDKPEPAPAEADEKSEEIGSNPLLAPVEYLGATARAKTSSQAKIALAPIQQAIQMYQVENGAFPPNLDALVQGGQIRALPALPQGSTYQYNPSTGAVTVSR
jgi:hypothetical protein